MPVLSLKLEGCMRKGIWRLGECQINIQILLCCGDP